MISLAQLITECIQLFRERLSKVIVVRESSFNMARRGDEDFEGWLRKFLATWKGGSEKIRGGGASKICVIQNQQEGGGAPKKLNR